MVQSDLNIVILLKALFFWALEWLICITCTFIYIVMLKVNVLYLSWSNSFLTVVGSHLFSKEVHEISDVVVTSCIVLYSTTTK